jgi:hypothetical protein
MQEHYKYLWSLSNTLSAPTRTYAEYWGSVSSEVVNANFPITDGVAKAYAKAVTAYQFITNGFLTNGVWTNDLSLQDASLCQWAKAEEWIRTNYWYETNLIVSGGESLAYSNIIGVSETFLSSCTWTNYHGATQADVLVIAGGGGGGTWYGGGGGAGGIVYATNYALVSNAEYSITVGSGGAGGPVTNIGGTAGSNGENSVFNNITANGGGGGGGYLNFPNGLAGGSGGGGSLPGGSGGAATQGGSGGGIGYGHAGNAAGLGNGGTGGGAGNSSGAGTNFDIAGSTVFGTGGVEGQGENGADHSGNGGNGNRGSYTLGGNGGSGLVVIRYSYVGLRPADHNPNRELTIHGSSYLGPDWQSPEAGGAVYCIRTNVGGPYTITYTSNGLTYLWKDEAANPLPYGNNYQPQNDWSTGVVAVTYKAGIAHPYYTGLTYQVTLAKIGTTNYLYASTNIEHKVQGFYAYSERPSFGTRYYTNQGLPLVESNYSCVWSNNWNWDSTNEAFLWDNMDIPPACPPEINTQYAVFGSNSLGFVVTAPVKSVADWKFLYCTNNWWN